MVSWSHAADVVSSLHSLAFTPRSLLRRKPLRTWAPSQRPRPCDAAFSRAAPTDRGLWRPRQRRPTAPRGGGPRRRRARHAHTNGPALTTHSGCTAAGGRQGAQSRRDASHAALKSGPRAHGWPAPPSMHAHPPPACAPLRVPVVSRCAATEPPRAASTSRRSGRSTPCPHPLDVPPERHERASSTSPRRASPNDRCLAFGQYGSTALPSTLSIVLSLVIVPPL